MFLPGIEPGTFRVWGERGREQTCLLLAPSFLPFLLLIFVVILQELLHCVREHCWHPFAVPTAGLSSSLGYLIDPNSRLLFAHVSCLCCHLPVNLSIRSLSAAISRPICQSEAWWVQIHHHHVYANVFVLNRQSDLFYPWRYHSYNILSRFDLFVFATLFC